MVGCSTIIRLPDSTRAADDPARPLGCPKAHIVKLLAFRDTATSRPALVLASGPNRVDEQGVATRIDGIPHIGHREPVT